MTDRNYRLDSLRGIAALVVILHHSVNALNPLIVPTALEPALSDVQGPQTMVARILLTIGAGGMAVYIFFILSGCVLIASLAREEEFGVDTVWRFCARRILRIMPASIAAVLAFGLGSHLLTPAGYAAPFSFEAISANVTLWSTDVIGASWTLQVEMIMVPVLLAVALVRRTLGTVALVGFLFWAQTTLIFGAPVRPDLMNVAFPAFALGMLVPTTMTKEAFSKTGPAFAIAMLVAMLAVRFYYPLADVGALLTILGMGFCVVASLAHSESKKHVFDNKALIFLGKISFSLYLIQVPVIYFGLRFYWMVFDQASTQIWYVPHGIVVALLTVLVTIPLAAVNERYVEQPFIRLSHALFGRKRKVSAGLAPA